MALTTGGALKARIESLGLGVAVYRNGAPEAAPYPFVNIQDGIGEVELREAHGDFGDPDAEVMVREECQVDVYQLSRKAGATQGSTAIAEDSTMMDRLRQGLRGARLGVIGTATGGAVVSGTTTRRRWPVKDNVARGTLSVFVDRPIQRSPLP